MLKPYFQAGLAILSPHLCHAKINSSSFFFFPVLMSLFRCTLALTIKRLKGHDCRSSPHSAQTFHSLLFVHGDSLPRPPCLVNKADFQWAGWHPSGCRYGYWMCGECRETLCNHFYFPLLASLLSDLDCISHGRQRQNKRMLAMVCVCVCVPTLGSNGGCRGVLRMVGGHFNTIQGLPSYGAIDSSWSMWAH